MEVNGRFNRGKPVKTYTFIIFIAASLTATSAVASDIAAGLTPCTPDMTSLEELLGCVPAYDVDENHPRVHLTSSAKPAPQTDDNDFIDSLIESLSRPQSTSEFRISSWVHPVPGELGHLTAGQQFGAARYGVRPADCGRGHCGIDLARKTGTPVYAASQGTVVNIGRQRHSKAGLWVELMHSNGFNSRYLHLDSIRSELRVGDLILTGERLGNVGNSGYSSHGSHLHFELFENGTTGKKYLNPTELLRHL